MIKANELRIGNWLQFDNMIQPSRRIKVNARFFSSLASGKAEQELKDEEPINEYYQPIPLTPEILEKAGFVNGSRNIFHFLNNGNLTIEGSEYDYNGLFIGKVNYLHQLQNLYFSLTGEELPVNFKDLTYQ